MATFMNTDCVKYVSNGAIAPLCELAFCRHCLELRSKLCVFHEVDSLYCPNCLENMPAAEAKARKNRCASCFDCPSCNNALSVRATSVMMEDPTSEGPGTPRKAFYLACGFCRWTSRDVGIKDQSVSSGGWPDQVNPHAQRIASLIDYYKQFALKELQEKEKKRYRRKSYLQLPDKYGFGHLSVKRRAGLSLNLIKDQSDISLPEIEPSKTSEEFPDLSDDYFTTPLNLAQVNNIKQRLANPEFQPMTGQDLYPTHKHMLIKRSQRCKECEHNLCRPEYNPSAIKFKIQLVAIHHVPEVRIMSLPVLKANQTSQVVLTLTNPLEVSVTVTLHHFDPDQDDFSTARIVFPESELQLGRMEDGSELEESPTFEDDPSVVAFRKANKLGVFASVTPLHEKGEVKVKLRMRHNYTKRMVTMPEKEMKDVEVNWLEHVVQVNFGNIEE